MTGNAQINAEFPFCFGSLQITRTTSARSGCLLLDSSSLRCLYLLSCSAGQPPALKSSLLVRTLSALLLVVQYAYIYHQKDMLEDQKRTSAYFNACIQACARTRVARLPSCSPLKSPHHTSPIPLSWLQNRRQFAGKVVLDVGTGSGILAIFAAKAGKCTRCWCCALAELLASAPPSRELSAGSGPLEQVRARCMRWRRRRWRRMPSGWWRHRGWRG